MPKNGEKTEGSVLEASIESVRIADVFDIWLRKPKSLAFNDTDAVIVTARGGGRQVTETFFTCVKPDGTFSLKTPNRVSQARRNRLARFLKYYKLADDPEKCNLRENIASWKGRNVKICVSNGGGHIFIP